MARAFLPHPITTDSAIGGTVIEKSLRFRHGRTNCVMTRTSETASSTYTFSAWVKHQKLDDYKYIFSSGNAGLAFYGTSSSNSLYIYDGSSLTTSTPYIRDTNSWYHIVMKMSSGTVYTYINGAVAHNGIGGFSLNTGGNSTKIGDYSTDHEFEGYVADVHLVDGQALDPTAFAYTEDQTGIWRPKRYTGTYGTSGFHLEFKDNSSTAAFGKDTSGNGNDFTTSGFIVGDSVPDSPTNNFTLLSRSNAMTGIRLAGLKFQNFNDSGGAQVAVQADRTIPNTGTWYWEIRWLGGSYTRYWGITRRLNNHTGVYYDNSGGVRYDMNSGKGYRHTGGSATEVFTGGFTGYNDNVTRILGMTVDMDQMVAKYYMNNSFVCSISIPELPSDGKGDYVFSWVSTNGGSSTSLNDRFNFGQDSSFVGAVTNQYKTDANGIGDFYYTPPDNALALCTQNIPPNLTSKNGMIDPKKHFDTLLYTGNGATSGHKITGLKFAPDFVWIKNRSLTYDHHLYDTIRGVGNWIESNQTDVEASGTHMDGFLHNGFSVGNGVNSNRTNYNGNNYAAWCWKAGGGYVTNNDGSVTSQVSANKDAGFSIVTYSGSNDSTVTFGHGLDFAPEMVLIKRRNNANGWRVYHHSIGLGKYLSLSNNAAAVTSSQDFASVSATTFGVKGGYNPVSINGGTYVAYCWHSVPGYSKFGIYRGNGQHGNNSFVDCGFKPAFVLYKAHTRVDDWGMHDNKRDTVNPVKRFLYPNDTYAEWTGGTNDHMDFYSTGFKVQNSGSMIGGSNEHYIYMAFASHPGDSVYDVVTNAR